MIFGIIAMVILYMLLSYILAWIRYFNRQDERLGQSTWRWSYDYEVDGERDISDLDVTNEELTVVGTVTNCTGDILQFTPGHDTTLSLETDTAEDRDIRLGGPSLDNANHLIPE